MTRDDPSAWNFIPINRVYCYAITLLTTWSLTFHLWLHTRFVTMINQFLNLDRFVLASDRLPTKYSCDDVLALFDAADQLHLVLGVNRTQRGHHFEILVDDYESLYHLQLNGLDDPARNLHLDLHPLQPLMVFHLTNVPLGATTDMVKALIQHTTEHRLSYINANQHSTTYRNSTIRTGRWTLTVWDGVADDTPLNMPKYSKYFPGRYVGPIHPQRRRRSPREQFEDPLFDYTSTSEQSTVPATTPTLVHCCILRNGTSKLFARKQVVT